jgi:predicted DNA-binding transcriptional regulator AlpA
MALDPLLRTREVARLEGITTRTLYERVRAGRFPRPDVPAEAHGAAAYWYESTVARVRAERDARLRRQASPHGAAA